MPDELESAFQKVAELARASCWHCEYANVGSPDEDTLPPHTCTAIIDAAAEFGQGVKREVLRQWDGNEVEATIERLRKRETDAK